MKKRSSDLFYLIKSLNAHEKGYLKKFASRHTGQGENKSVTLFEVITEQYEYNEQEAFKKTKAKSIKQFSELKNHLYEVILKGLDFYHAGKNVKADLKNLLHYIDILYNKGLYKQCEIIVMQAKNNAQEHEHYSELLEIINWEQRLIKTLFKQDKTEKNLETLAKEKRSIIEKIKNLDQYEELYNKMPILYGKSSGEGIRTQMELKKYKAIMSNPLLKDINKALSHQAKRLFYYLHERYFYATGDYKNNYKYAKLLTELWESSPLKIKDAPNAYIVALNNLVVAQSKLNKYDECLQTVCKLRIVPAKSKDIQARIFSRSYSTELDIYITTGGFEKVVEISSSIDEGLQQFKNEMDDAFKIIFYYNLSYLYFGIGDYSKCLMWLNKIFNETNINVREDAQCFARILNLIVHFELGNNELLEYAVISTYRFLYKRNRLYKFENYILTFIRKKLPKLITREEQIIAFKELETELKKLSKDPFERKALDYFDFISWLKSKIENRPFVEIVREKGNKVISVFL